MKMIWSDLKVILQCFSLHVKREPDSCESTWINPTYSVNLTSLARRV